MIALIKMHFPENHKQWGIITYIAVICKILSKNPLHNLIVSSPLAPISHSFIADDCGVIGPSLVAQMIKDLPAMLET